MCENNADFIQKLLKDTAKIRKGRRKDETVFSRNRTKIMV